MALVFRLAESLLFAAMGTFMVVLSRSSLYWQFLSPKYSWITFSVGLLIVGVAVGLLFDTHRRRTVGKLAGIAIFLCLAAGGVVTSQTDDFAPPAGLTGGEYPTEREAASVVVDGREYVRINVVELLVGENRGWSEEGGAYAIQGIVVRTPQLDAAGYIAVGRLFIQCCFADSVGVVTLVRVDDPEAYTNGQWVRAAGVLQKGIPPLQGDPPVHGALTSARSERFVLAAAHVEEHAVEGVPFIFEVREAPPFAY